MIIKLMRKTVIFLLGLFLLVATVQFGAIYYFSHRDGKISPAELLVVFPGTKERLIAGCDLAADGIAPRFMVISLTADKLAEICSKHDRQAGKTVKTISSGKSRSTFEDVYNTISAIEHHKITSVILVTSAYHLPRSAFLLKTSLALKGHDVTVQFHPVAEERVLPKKLQLYFNEFAKLFGSTAEMAWYFSTGHLMLDSPQFREARTFIKKYFLFLF